MKAKRIWLISALVWTLLIFLDNAISAQHYEIGFIDYPCIRPLKAYRYLTCSPLRAIIDKKEITIPEAFNTDLASIPRIFWFLISPAYSEFIAPSILHDYLYRFPNGYTRKNADDIFYDSLVGNGVSVITAYVMFLGVRMFGHRSFSHQSIARSG